MGGIEDKFILLYPHVYYQWQYMNWFEFLFHNLECVTDLCC